MTPYGKRSNTMEPNPPNASSKPDEKQEKAHVNQANSSENGTSEGTLSEERNGGIWDSDQLVKTARYNYATDKSLSHVDAKLFYQRHKLETSQQDYETTTPLSRIGTASIEELGGLSRTNSATSRRSCYGSRRRKINTPSVLPLGVSGLDEPVIRPPRLSSDLDEADPYGPHPNQTVREDGPSPHKASTTYQNSGVEAEAPPSDMGGSYIAPEMRTICTSIKKVLEIRHKYVALSLQRPNDNPKDHEDWRIYPPAPQPVWDDVKNRPSSLNSGANSLANSKVLGIDHHTACNGSFGGSSGQNIFSSAKKPRKAGQDIGEDFDLSELLPLPEEAEAVFKLDNTSVYQVYETPNSIEISLPMVKVPTLRDFYSDLEYVKDVSSDGPSKSFAYRELDILEGKYNLYFLVNEYQETAMCKRVPHRDFYNVRKVDTHVHHSACMNQKHLLRFIKSKMKKSPDDVVLFRDDKRLTLKEVFESINLTAYDLSIDTLDMHVCLAPFDTSSIALVADIDCRPIPIHSIGSINSISNIIPWANHVCVKYF
jgi:AMP deaminase